MSFCTVHFHGASINKATSMNVILPAGRGPFPVLYLLHGLSDDHTIWARRTSLERTLDGVPLIVVMPDGHRSFYINDERPGGLAYEDHFARDIVQFVDETFHTVAARKGRAAAGLSMGGYGATLLAMRHPETFAAACSHSGALGFSDSLRYVLRKRANPAGIADIVALEEQATRSRCNLYLLAKKLAKAGRRNRFAYRLDCGTEDSLLDENRKFHAHLDKLGIAHEYAEHPGDHNWAYWDAHIGETIQFVMKHLG